MWCDELELELGFSAREAFWPHRAAASRWLRSPSIRRYSSQTGQPAIALILAGGAIVIGVVISFGNLTKVIIFINTVQDMYSNFGSLSRGGTAPAPDPFSSGKKSSGVSVGLGGVRGHTRAGDSVGGGGGLTSAAASGASWDFSALPTSSPLPSFMEVKKAKKKSRKARRAGPGDAPVPRGLVRRRKARDHRSFWERQARLPLHPPFGPWRSPGMYVADALTTHLLFAAVMLRSV